MECANKERTNNVRTSIKITDETANSDDWLVWLVGFYGLSTIVGYLKPLCVLPLRGEK